MRPTIDRNEGAGVRALDIYGLRVSVDGDWPEVVEALRQDYLWFASEQAAADPDVRLRVERAAPDFDALGPLTASFVTPRNVVFQDGARTAVDYFGRALALLDRKTGMVTVQGEEEHLVHEAAYLYLLSRAGEHLDSRGLTRLHALGLAGGQGAVALMLPSGGGKTTMALRSLSADGVRLLSEDTPLLDRRGMLHPFPLRIGVNEAAAAGLPFANMRRIERMEFPPKVLIPLDAFADRIEPDPRPLAHLVIGRRTLAREARLEPLPRRVAVGPLLREAVIGLGVYQGMEFVLQRGFRDVLGMTGVAAARTAHCVRAISRARVWRLALGRDQESNWRALEPLFR
jgi:hypothetical protein